MSFRDFSIVYALYMHCICIVYALYLYIYIYTYPGVYINIVAMIAARLSGPLDFLQFSHVLFQFL